MNAQKTKQILKENRNVFLLTFVIVLSLGLLYYVIFVNSQTSQFFRNNKPTEQQTKNYPAFDTSLNEVVSSTNPKDAAEKSNLAVEDNAVKVLITLNDESFVLTDIYGKEVLRYGKYIQAIVKFDKLEELAKNPQIKSIQAPLKSNRVQK